MPPKRETEVDGKLQSTVAGLKSDQSAERAKLKKFISEVRDLYKKKEEADDDALAYSLNRMAKQYAALNKIDSQLIELNVVPDDESSTLQEEYEHMEFLARRLLDRLEKYNDRSSSSSSKPALPVESYADLPKIELSKFDGNPLQWRPFWDDFRATVHDRTIPTVKKFSHLRKCLVGNAREALSSYSLSEANYPLAVAELQRRYGDPAQLIGLYATQLVSLPPVARSDLRSFRALLDQFSISLSEIRSLASEMQLLIPAQKSGSEAQPVTLSSLLLAPLLMSKLPEDVILSWRRSTGQPADRFDLDALLEYARTELENREAVRSCDLVQPSMTKSSEQPPRRIYSRPSSGRSPRNSPVACSALLTSDVPNSCHLCKGERHPYWKCDTFHSKSPQDRAAFIKSARLCFNCFGQHPTAECRSIRNCRHCGRRHHSLLCFSASRQPVRPHNQSHDRKHPVTPSSTPSSTVAGSTSSFNAVSQSSCPPRTSSSLQFLPSVNSTSSSAEQCESSPVCTAFDPKPSYEEVAHPVFLKIARVLIRAPGASQGTYVYCYLDDGSRRSYIRADLARELGLTSYSTRTLMTGSFGENVTQHKSSRVCFELQDAHGMSVAIPLSAWTTEKLCPPVQQERLVNIPPPYAMLHPWADQYDGTPRQISILLGADTLWDVCSGQVFRAAHYPACIETAFGWVLSGPFARAQSFPGISSASRLPDPAHFINDDDISQLWSLEPLGIKDDPGLSSSDRFPPPVFCGDRYEVRLPFKDDRRPQSNFQTALAQSVRLETRYSSDQMVQYDVGMQSLCERNVASPVPNDTKEGFYLPHHGVWKSKLRIVFNGAAVSPDGRSLNEYLDPGPNLLVSLLLILLRFRLRPYPVNADIEAAFHCVQVHPDDRKWLKFIWRGKVFQFNRVPFGLTCSPYLLHSTIIHHIQTLTHGTPDLKEMLLKSLYCDDLLASFDHFHSAKIFLQEAVDTFAVAGMKLKVLTAPSKVLGVSWQALADTFSVDLQQVQPPRRYTRRELLRYVSQIYDPLGILTPWTICLRKILQLAWKSGEHWDDVLKDNLIHRFHALVQGASGVSVTIPRCLHIHNESRLHVFCDGSQTAYACVAYLVHPSLGIRFVFSKARVTPIKPALTIPRVELMAALIGCRFAKMFVTKVFQVPVTFWTDAQVILRWIKKGPSKRDVFVANRVSEILTFSEPDQWRYVPTHLNPADLPTRGCSLSELNSDCHFYQGPDFLSHPESNWPVSPPALPVLITIEEPADKTPHVVKPEHYSSFMFFLRVTTWILRLVTNFRRRLRGLPLFAGPLIASELNEALIYALRVEQSQTFGNEIAALRSGSKLSSSSRLYPLKPRLSTSGLLVLTPRTGGPELPILPPKSPLTALLVTHYHRKLCHQGAETTLSELRRHVWIMKARSLVKRLVWSCVDCRRFKAPPFRTSEAQLQPFRTSPQIPFHTTGIDHFGPVYLLDHSKVWVLLMTCATTRAIHLELVLDSSAASAYLAIRRFLARRVRPFSAICVYSDNAKSFLQLSSMKFPNHHITWKTIPERSPNWGGWWERLIRTVKTSLRITYRNLRCRQDELEALLQELESLINLRPLTHVSSDPGDPPALCPADFLLGIGSSDASRPPVRTEPDLHRLKLQRVRAAEIFWNRWSSEYLSSLSLWRRQTSSSYQPSPGQVVLVQEKTPRGTWALARIEKLLLGQDHQPRAAVIRLHGKLTRRAIRLLVPLEADAPPPLPHRGGTESLGNDYFSDHDDPISADVPACTNKPDPTANLSSSTSRSGRPLRPPQRYQC